MSSPQEFLGQATAQANIRPRRLAYLVKAGDAESLRAAIEYATSEWGGMGHPIVPVYAGGRAPWMSLLEDLFPEAVIDFSGADPRFLERHQDKYGIPFLSYDNLQQFAEPGVHAVAALAPGSLRGLSIPLATHQLRSQVSLGIIRDSDLELWETTGGQFFPSVSPQGEFFAQLDLRSPIGLTTNDFPGYEVAWRIGDPVVVQVVGPGSLRQMISFWNWRAMAVPVWGLERLILTSADTVNAPVAAKLRDWCIRKTPGIPDLFLVGPDKEVLLDMGRRLGFEDSQATRIEARWLDSRPRDPNAEPLSFMANVRFPTSPERLGGRRVDLAFPVIRPRTRLRIESPVPLRPYAGNIRLDLQQAEALRWPQSPAVAKAIHAEAEFTRHGLSWTVSPERRYELEVAIPTGAEICTAYLGDKGWTWGPSDKGRYAGALAPVESEARREVLARRTNWDIITALMPSGPGHESTSQAAENEPLGEASREVRVAGGPWKTAQVLSAELGGGFGLTRVLESLQELTREHLVRRAFRVICETCGLRLVIPLGEEGESFNCPGCGSSNTFFGEEGREPQFAYALNTLLERALNQGCASHLLVQRVAGSELALEWSVPGANVTRADGTMKEVDLLGVSRTEVVVGEVKTSLALLPEACAERAQLCRDLGASHLVLATLEEWTQDARKTAEQAAKDAGVKVRLLGGSDLFA